MRGMEANQAANGPAPREQCAQRGVGKDALDEVLAQPGVAQAALFLDWEVRHRGDQRFGEQPAPLALAHASPTAVDLHPLEATAR